MTPEQARELANDRLMEADEVAKLCALTKDYVYLLARRKQIPHLRPGGGRHIRFRRSSILAWIADQEIGGEA